MGELRKKIIEAGNAGYNFRFRPRIYTVNRWAGKVEIKEDDQDIESDDIALLRIRRKYDELNSVMIPSRQNDLRDLAGLISNIEKDIKKIEKGQRPMASFGYVKKQYLESLNALMSYEEAERKRLEEQILLDVANAEKIRAIKNLKEDVYKQATEQVSAFIKMLGEVPPEMKSEAIKNFEKNMSEVVKNLKKQMDEAPEFFNDSRDGLIKELNDYIKGVINARTMTDEEIDEGLKNEFMIIGNKIRDGNRNIKNNLSKINKLLLSSAKLDKNRSLSSYDFTQNALMNRALGPYQSGYKIYNSIGSRSFASGV